jgi:3',5'-cyclic AMP phosphodiesterase CpdA
VDNCLLVRRVPNLAEAGRQEIARVAASLRGTPYDFSAIFKMVLSRFAKRFGVPSTSDEAAGLVCSNACEHAILAATRGQVSIRRDRDHVVTPGDLAETATLVDAHIPWMKVVH